MTTNQPSGEVLKKAYDSGSLHKQKKKMSSKVALDKMKGFSTAAGSRDSTSTNTNTTGKSAAAVGKGTLKNLGFKMSKNTALNFYEKWKFEEYPETVISIFDTLMKSVGVGIVQYGEEEDDFVGKFMEQLHSKLSENSNHYGTLIPKNNRRLFKTVTEQIEELLATQKKIQSVILTQSLIRRHQTQKRVKAWINEEGVKYTQTKRHQINVAFRDLLETEQTYIKGLETVVNVYLVPLRKMTEAKRTSMDMTALLQGRTGATLNKEDIDAIFSNIETLLSVHKKTLQKLQGLKEKWPFIDNIGGTFLKIAPDLIPYGDYVQNCKNALDTLLRLQEQDQKFKSFLEESTLSGGGDLMGLIVRPLNHISQYTTFLKIAVNNTATTDKDYENLRNAYISIKKTSKYIVESYKGASNRAKIVDIQRRWVLPKGVTMELYSSKRVFQGEGPIGAIEKTLMISTEKSRIYFLFNDLFLLAEESGKQYKILHIFHLKETTVEEVTAPNAHQFSLLSGDEKSVLSCKTSGEKVELMKKIRSNIESLSITHRVFGVPLTKLLEREKPADGIPFIVRTCTDFLRKKRELEGIFRISGSTGEVATLKELFNKLAADQPKEVKLDSYSPYSIAAILKMFFRELPEPIFTFGAFKPLTNISLDEKDVKSSVEKVKQIVSTIPPENQALIKYISAFLISVARFGTVNKMNISNISIVFGPNLLFPSEETLETILLIPRLNFVFQFIFENFTDIFGPVNTN